MIGNRLPNEIVGKIFSFLSWKDVGKGWLTCRKLYRTLKDGQKPEWKTFTLTGTSQEYLLEKIAVEESFEMRNPPNLVIVTVFSADDQIFRRGAWWIRMEAVLQQKIPSEAILVCIWSKNGVISAIDGQPRELHSEEGPILLSISAISLPGAKLQAFTAERAAIKQSYEQILANSNTDTPSSSISLPMSNETTPQFPINAFMIMSSNFSCCDRFVQVLSNWKPQAPILGGMFPFTDRGKPLAYRCPIGTGGNLEVNAKHVVVAIGGSASLIPVASLGFTPCSNILRCVDADQMAGIDGLGQSPYYLYSRVADGETTMTPREAMQKYHLEKHHTALANCEINPLYLIETRDRHTLEAFHDHQREQLIRFQVTQVLDNSEAGLICCNGLWDKNGYGQLYTIGAREACEDMRRSLQSARAATSDTVVGAFTFACVSRGENLYGERDVELHQFNMIFPQVPIAGCFAQGEIGPRVPYGGFSSAADSSSYMMDSYMTVIAIFSWQR